MDFAGDEQYTSGTPVIPPHQGKKQGDKEDLRPFAFDSTHRVEEAELWANSDQVHFVQSQEGAMYTDLGDEAYRRMARMEEGTVCHEIFAGIKTIADLDGELDKAMTQGLIKSPEQREELRSLIASSWEGNEQMHEWFTLPWELRLEEPIYIDGKELRPDRVMINPQTNEAIVLDYKFGGEDKQKYFAQVREYMQAMRDLEYAKVRGFLWYARMHKLEEVK